MSERSETRTVQIELTQENYAIIHELVLRGLNDLGDLEREYGDAYDEFVKNAPVRIGDQPDRVKEVWEEIFGPPVKREEIEMFEERDDDDR